MIIVKKPKIRFKGFTETWEQRKFKNIVERLSESYMSDDKNPSVEYEDIISELGTINKDIFNKRIRKNGIKFSNDEILYGKLRPYLHNWLKPDFNGIAVGDWWVLKPINCDREFIFRLIQTSTFDNIANQSNGTKMPRADWNLIANSDFYLPISIYEQKQIGSLFSKLDTLITLHQRKCENLKKLKKFMLQKMFPQNGENVPEIHFSNFTDTWEQRKLFDFTYFYNGLTYTPDDVRENGTLVLRSSNVKHSEIVLNDNVYVDPIKVNSEYVKKGDIIIVVRNGSRALIGKHAVIKDEMPNTVIGAFMSGIRSQYSFFINSLLDTSQFKEEILRNLGATINQITGYMFSKMEFMIPSCYEQKIIGDYFLKLDNLITLHQSKCDNLKELKKYMLQNMFI